MTKDSVAQQVASEKPVTILTQLMRLATYVDQHGDTPTTRAEAAKAAARMAQALEKVRTSDEAAKAQLLSRLRHLATGRPVTGRLLDFVARCQCLVQTLAASAVTVMPTTFRVPDDGPLGAPFARRTTRLPAPWESYAQPGDVAIRTFDGLGDVLQSLATAYALSERGYRVDILPTASSERSGTTVLSPFALPTLPLLSRCPGAPEFDQQPRNWQEPDVTAADLAGAGLEAISTPRYGMLLAPPPETAERTRRFKLGAPYILVSPDGNWRAPEKALSEKQLRAVAATAEALGLDVVTVGRDKTSRWAPGRDLRGATTLDELCLLVSEAAAVVSAETGTAHLAAAYSVPCLVIAPQITRPVMRYHAPKLELVGPTAAAVAPSAVGVALSRLVAAARTDWVMVGNGKHDCGVAETARTLAAAAGVPAVTFEDRDPDVWAIAEWLDTYEDRPPARRTVLSAHRVDTIETETVVPDYPAVIWHKADYLAEYGPLCRRAWYVPLPTLNVDSVAQIPERPRLIAWHGHVHRRKGLRLLIAAFEELRRAIPDARLLLLAGVGHWDSAEQAWFETVSGPGIQREQKAYWSPEELTARLAEADVHVYPEVAQGEQSGASAAILALGKPVVVSASERHDEVRGWCLTAGDNLADTLARVLTDRELYARLCVRAIMGASYRSPQIIARQYRAIVIQAILDAERCT